MPSPLLLFRVGYMTSYAGVGDISGGGSWVDEKGEGGEMWNFRQEAGRCYAYVMTKAFAGIDTNLVVPGSHLAVGDELQGVDIVFIAKRPGYGQVVVGWYRGATVFHKKYLKRRGRKKAGDWDSIASAFG